MSPVPLVMVVGGQQTRVVAAAEALKAEGYEVRTCHGLSDARGSLGSLPPALVVIDTSALDGDPIAFVRYVKRTSSAAVIVCDRGALPGFAVKALEAGADDCVRDTCSARELSLRARAILARVGPHGPPGRNTEAD